MNEEASPQVIVGVTGSLASLHALRYAVAEARRRNAVLNVVHVYRIGKYHEPTVMNALREPLNQAAFQPIHTCLNEALGGPPRELALRQTVVGGEAPGPILVGLVRAEGDLLVLGRSRRRRGFRVGGQVGRYCAQRAACPVLVVPPPELARALGGPAGLRRRLERALAAELQADTRR